jgi:hypothetical protein
MPLNFAFLVGNLGKGGKRALQKRSSTQARALAIAVNNEWRVSGLIAEGESKWMMPLTSVETVADHGTDSAWSFTPRFLQRSVMLERWVVS